MTAVRVVLADRSAVVRSLLRRALENGGEIQVVGESGHALEAVDFVRRYSPDSLVTDLDLVGPAGRDYLEAVAEAGRVAVFALIPNIRGETTRQAFAAHDLGVVGVHPKPDQPEGWVELGEDLKASILEARSSGVEGGRSGLSQGDEIPPIGRGLRWVAVGASTGGPGAICELLKAVKERAHVGIAVVQHIASGFEYSLAEWLALETGLDVAVARDGERLAPGMVRFAPADGQLLLSADGTLSVDRRMPAINGHRPSVDALFRSLLEHPGDRVAAVQLSGMGSDGAGEMSKLREAGVLTIAQDERSCAVFGMPGTAISKGAATFVLDPAQIGRLLAHAAGADG